MKHIKKIAFSIFFIIIGWLLSDWYSTFKQDTVIPEVITITVGKGRLQEKISLSTKVSEKEIINVTSRVATGIVERIYVKPGDYVEKGQKLLSLRKEELINNLKKEEFNLECEKKRLSILKDPSLHPEVVERNEEIKRIEMEIKEVSDTLEDTKELYLKGASSYREVERQEKEKKRKEMDLKRAQAKLNELISQIKEQKRKSEIEISAIRYRIKELKDQIAACEVTSPIKGMIRRVNVYKNQKVEYGTLLGSISTTDELVAIGPLKESNFFLVKVGQNVELISEELGRRFKGKVLKVVSYPSIEKDTKSEAGKEVGGDIQVICSIDNPKGLVVGMILSCEIIIREAKKESIVIPPEVLYEEDAVLVVEKGRVRKKKIVLGESTIDQIEVIDGLIPGEKVIAHYPEEIEEGMKVKVREGG